MKMTKRELSILIEKFLFEQKEESEDEKSDSNKKKPVLHDLKVESEGITAEIKVDDIGNHSVYINGIKTEDIRKEAKQKVAIISKAFKNIKFDMADNKLSQPDIENILLWGDEAIEGGRKTLQSATEGSRLSVGWNTQIVDISKGHVRNS